LSVFGANKFPVAGKGGLFLLLAFFAGVSGIGGVSTVKALLLFTDLSSVAGKLKVIFCTGVFLDTYNGGGSFDLNGAPNAAGSGRLAAYANNLSTWGYGPSIYYTAPDTSGNVGQVLFG
jgi:hypothetical protein